MHHLKNNHYICTAIITKNDKKMKNLLFIMIAALLTLASCNSAQTAQQKKIQNSIDSIAHLKAIQAIEQGYFVLRATSMSDMYGHLMSGLSENANFLLVQGKDGMYQFAAMRANPGLNGLGGVTLDGEVRDLKIKYGKTPNDDVEVKYRLVGIDINADVQITLFKGSDQATALVMPMLEGGTITVRGQLSPYRQ